MSDEGSFSATTEDGARAYMATGFNKTWDYDAEGQAMDHDTIDWVLIVNIESINGELAIASQRRKTPVKIVHATWQFEECPETGAAHFHMLIQLSDKVKYTQLRKLPFFANLTRVNFKSVFNAEGCEEYCSKEPTRISGPYSFGKLSTTGERNDIHQACDLMKEAGYGAKGYKRVAEDMPHLFIKFHRGMKELCTIQSTKIPFEKQENIILYVGESGAGKTHAAINDWPDVYKGMYKKYDNLYFDGYDSQETLFFDEFTGSMPFQKFKELFNPNSDPRGHVLACREAAVKLGSRNYIFCSNKLPTMWWDFAKLNEDPKTLFRRFTKVIWYGGMYGEDDEEQPWHKEFTGWAEIKEFMGFCTACSGLGINEVYQRARDQYKSGVAATANRRQLDEQIHFVGYADLAAEQAAASKFM